MDSDSFIEEKLAEELFSLVDRKELATLECLLEFMVRHGLLSDKGWMVRETFLDRYTGVYWQQEMKYKPNKGSMAERDYMKDISGDSKWKRLED